VNHLTATALTANDLTAMFFALAALLGAATCLHCEAC
jgi:hypothetical protein